MEVLAVSSDIPFNFFFSLGVYWGFMMASFFAVLTLFRA